MGSLANSLINVLLGWVKQAASWIWNLFSGKGTDFFQWMGKNWLWVTVILCVLGMAADLAVYWFRWRPMEVWLSWLDRRQHKDRPRTEPEQTMPDEEQPQTDENLFQPEDEPVNAMTGTPERQAFWSSGVSEEKMQLFKEIPAAPVENPPAEISQRIRRSDRHRKRIFQNGFHAAQTPRQNPVNEEDAFHQPTMPQR